MAHQPLQPDSNFVVKDDKFLNLLIAGLCFIFFGLAMISFTGQLTDYLSIPLFLGPTIFFVHKAYKNDTLIVINKHGIYYGRTLVTNWQNFYNAHLKEVEKMGQVSDNFQIEVTYYNQIRNGFLHKHIKLGNTQSKSEESIMDAIRYFHRLYKDNNKV